MTWCQILCHTVKKYVYTSKIMKSMARRQNVWNPICDSVIKIRQNVSHDVKKYFMMSKVFHEVKSMTCCQKYVMMSKVCNDVNKYVIAPNKNTSWRKNYDITSKSTSSRQKNTSPQKSMSHVSKVSHVIKTSKLHYDIKGMSKNTSWHQKSTPSCQLSRVCNEVKNM